MEITERIKTFEDACAYLGASPTPQMEEISIHHIKSVMAYYKLCIITQALNEGWQPDFSNRAEEKFFPRFGLDEKGGIAILHSFSTLTFAHSGPRFCFKSEALCYYATVQFNELYQDMLS